MSNSIAAPTTSQVVGLSGTTLFPSAGWLHSGAPTSGTDISNLASQYLIGVNDSTNWGFPIQIADGSHGFTTFFDNSSHSTTGVVVPNPVDGYHPTIQSDGHLVVVNPTTGQYYDFWTLKADSNGNPTSTRVGRIETGSLNGVGTPGTTATGVTGLAGDILPGELDTANGIQHALNVVAPSWMTRPGLGTQGPPGMTGSDGSVQGGVFQEGTQLFIPKSVNVDSLNVSTAVKSIMHALQNYGGLITDQGGSMAFYSDIPQSQIPDLTGIEQIKNYLRLATANASTPSGAMAGDAANNSSVTSVPMTPPTATPAPVTPVDPPPTPPTATPAAATPVDPQPMPLTATSAPVTSVNAQPAPPDATPALVTPVDIQPTPPSPPPVTPVVEPPALTVERDALSVQPGGSVPLGVSVWPISPHLAMTISGVPRFETITADDGAPVHMIGGRYSFTAADANSGLTLHSRCQGNAGRTNELTVTATDTSSGEMASTPAQTPTVTILPAMRTSRLFALLNQYAAAGFHDEFNNGGGPTTSLPSQTTSSIWEPFLSKPTHYGFGKAP